MPGFTTTGFTSTGFTTEAAPSVVPDSGSLEYKAPNIQTEYKAPDMSLDYKLPDV